MKIIFKKDHILVIWPWFVRLSGRLVFGTNDAKGTALYPFIFVLQEENPDWLITHELIHFRQEVEAFFIGLIVIAFVERLYARFILKKNKMERYLYAATEQEAYLNMHNPDYLSTRPFGRVLYYIRHKREFRFTGPGQIEVLD